MFATYAGAYNRKPLPGLPDRIGQAERERAEGRLDEAGYADVADALVREVLDEMAVVGRAIVGDGGGRDADRVLPWIRGLGGLAPGLPAMLPHGESVTRPNVTGPVRWTEPVTVADWRFADGAS